MMSSSLTNAPPQTNKTFEVSKAIPGWARCYHPSSGGTVAIVPSRSFSRWCWTPRRKCLLDGPLLRQPHIHPRIAFPGCRDSRFASARAAPPLPGTVRGDVAGTRAKGSVVGGTRRGLARSTAACKLRPLTTDPVGAGDACRPAWRARRLPPPAWSRAPARLMYRR